MTDPKKIMLLILTIFVYHFTFQYGNLIRTDRDDALTIASERFLDNKAPYDTLTALNNPITTGVSSIYYATLLSERNLSFLFWLIIISIFYTGKHFILFSIIIMLTLIFFQRTMMYRLDELYYGMIPLYYGVRNKNGFFLSLAFMNRISYMIFIYVFLFFNRKLIFHFTIGIVLMCLFINPIPFIENNFIMLSIPKYPLDYSLLFILPVMFLLNDIEFNSISPRFIDKSPAVF